ncbi:MAG: PadR family transcriptional regulator [Candidatus Muirbacterium halophilum]|nr:PadR family transcriptional regulator [Candidatus Muirbacterium halophilum]MCK9474453.1 PadR family transcriptional regulator [Candidatus Muirbacterium halophilum]
MNSQFKKGVLEICVLSLINLKDCYGYEIVSEISERMKVTSGTIYPLLTRLKKEGYFENYVIESDEGPMRKYYKITQHGKTRVDELIIEWKKFVKQVDSIIKTSF